MKNIVLTITVLTLIAAMAYVDEPPKERSTDVYTETIGIENHMEPPEVIQEYPLFTSDDMEELQSQGEPILDEGSIIEDELPTNVNVEENNYDLISDTAKGEETADSSWDEEAYEEAVQEEQGMVYVGTYQITAYEWTGNPCANGNYPEEGYTAACNSLPFGTVVYIDGVGYRTIEDRGATWHRDEWIDVYMGDEWSCNQFGVQYLDVWIVE